MPHLRADLLRQMPHREEGEVRKMPDKCPGGGGMGGLGIDRAIISKTPPTMQLFIELLYSTVS